MDKIVVEYDMTRERVIGYKVYLTNNSEDVIYICKHSPKILNTLFNNIILLELSNWNRIICGNVPLRTIDDYTSLMFELDNGSNKQSNLLLKKIVDNSTSFARLQKKFQDYKNTNRIIPAVLWKKQIA